MKALFNNMVMAVALTASSTSLALAETSRENANLDIEVSGLAPASGRLMVAVYASEADWDGNNALRGAQVEVDGGSVTIAFDDLMPGSYGIKMYHDVDSDGVMDTNLMGIPTEPFAFSNNARGSFGPASWTDANFAIDEGGNVHSIRFE